MRPATCNAAPGSRRLLAAGLLALAGLLAVAPVRAPAAQPDFQLPALAQPPDALQLSGKVAWLDLVTQQLPSERRFYAQLFGWDFRDVRMRDRTYAIAWVDQQPVAGLLERPLPAGQAHHPAWLTFFSVRDIQAAKRRALAHGARLLVDVRNYPDRGQQAILTDPEGAAFALLQPSGGVPTDALAEPGERIWSALLCRHPDQEAGFYQEVFGYEVYDLSSGSAPDAANGADDASHLLLASGGYARAGVDALPMDQHTRHAHWLNFVRVQEVGASVRQAEMLGARVLVTPRQGRHGDQLAVIADPSGAPLGLMQWSAPLKGAFGPHNRPEGP